MRQTDAAPKRGVRTFPRWGFAILAAGGLWASGVYVGMIRASGASTGDVAGAIGFGLLGLVMLWGVLGRRR